MKKGARLHLICPPGKVIFLAWILLRKKPPFAPAIRGSATLPHRCRPAQGAAVPVASTSVSVVLSQKSAEFPLMQASFCEINTIVVDVKDEQGFPVRGAENHIDFAGAVNVNAQFTG